MDAQALLELVEAAELEYEAPNLSARSAKRRTASTPHVMGA